MCVCVVVNEFIGNTASENASTSASVQVQSNTHTHTQLYYHFNNYYDTIDTWCTACQQDDNTSKHNHSLICTLLVRILNYVLSVCSVFVIIKSHFNNNNIMSCTCTACIAFPNCAESLLLSVDKGV